MFETLFAIAMLASPATPARGADDAEVVAVVKQFVESLNKGDAKGVVGTCADQTSIIDEFPPHEWHGAGACANWLSDAGVDEKKNQISDAVVTLGKPSHVDVTGDRAYVVVPADYEFKQKGKPVKEAGSILTMALQKGATGWRIIGWSWAKH
jgi:ketosteroid isomerase-like protein